MGKRDCSGKGRTPSSVRVSKKGSKASSSSTAQRSAYPDNPTTCNTAEDNITANFNVVLSHNPYTIESALRLNGSAAAPTWFEVITEGKRLQVWLDDFVELLWKHESSSLRDPLSFCFRGTEQDAYDVQDSLSNTCEQRHIALDFTQEASGSPERKLEELKELYAKAKTGPIKDYRSLDLEKEFNNITKADFEVVVIGTMNSGKSTLLNAMLGEDLLPWRTEACTATILKIRDRDGQEGFVGQCFFNEDDSTWVLEEGKYANVTKAILDRWNRDDVAGVVVEGNIPNVSSREIPLTFVDTPGRNNERNKNHGKRLQKFITDRKMPMVMYLIPAGNDTATDNHALLELVAGEMKRRGRQSSDRFMFIISRADEIDLDQSGISAVHDCVTKWEEDLRKIGIRQPRIYPISAKAALLIRMNTSSQKLTSDKQSDLINLLNKLLRSDEGRPTRDFNQYMKLSSFVRDTIEQRVEVARKRKDKKKLAELYSGLPAIELVMQEYMDKYAFPARIHDAASQFKETIDRHNAEDKLFKYDEKVRKELRQFLEAQQKEAEKSINAQQYKKKLEEREDQEYWVKEEKSVEELINKIVVMNERFRQQIAPDLDPAALDREVDETQANEWRNEYIQRVTDIAQPYIDEYNREAEEYAQKLRDKYEAGYRAHLVELLSIPDKELSESIAAIVMPSMEVPLAEAFREIKRIPFTQYEKYFKIPFYRLSAWFGEMIGVNLPSYGHKEKSVITPSKFLGEMDKWWRKLVAQINLDRELAVQGIQERYLALFLEKLDGLEKECQQRMSDLMRKLQAKESKKKKVHKSIDWHKDFVGSLDAILSI